MWHDRPYKATYRNFAVANQGKPARVYLTLPSDEILDIKAALSHRSIDRKTFIIAVEKDKKKAKTIRELLATMFDDYHVHAGPLHTLDLTTVLAGRKIDMAFFDLCGQMTKDIAGWLLALDKNTFTLGARVCWTFNLNFRTNSMVERMSGINMWKQIHKLERIVSRCPQVTLTPFFKQWYVCSPMSREVTFTLYALYGALSSHWKFSLDKVHEYHDVRAPMLFIQTTIGGVSGWSEEKAWEVLGCPSRMSAGQKMSHVKAAKRGVRPPWMKPQQWAWCPLNPNSIRRVA